MPAEHHCRKLRLSSLSILFSVVVSALGQHEKPRHYHRYGKFEISLRHPFAWNPRWMKAAAYFGTGNERTHAELSFPDEFLDIYGANYFITDVPAENLTYLVYVFANVNTTTGSVYEHINVFGEIAQQKTLYIGY
ncbi:Endochitinase B1 [Penicillium canescens]|uniref:Endochitinase B1 n=1 Tax=Penicillium canescens TaxID=5083 RepID=UPI0026E02D4E|nr:Endochitinase B1 [Penicillium canescens]KAJ6046958.1 Endochitinase B1 [Penicillium canescens]